MNALRLMPPLLTALLTSAVFAQTDPPRLGRLFMTPESRAYLERQRQSDIRETRSLEGGSIRLDGVVVRSTGKSTVWVNKRPQSESEHDTGVAAAISRRQPGAARLLTGDEPPADLKVGATLNRATREIEDGLAGGEIRVNPPAKKR